MFVKVQLREINKKVNLNGIVTYADLVSKVKVTFNNTIDGFSFYYYDSDKQRIQVDNDDSFLAYLGENEKPKMIIKLPDQDFLNQSFLRNPSKDTSSILGKLKEEEQEGSEIKLLGNFSKGKESVLDESQGSIEKQSKPSDIKETNSVTKKGQEEKVERVIQQKKQVPIKEQPKVNKTVHKNIKCNHCNKEIVGIRWKCLDQFDVDVCNQCYEAKIHKVNHTFLKIETEDYLSKLNYRDSIYRLFNPKYEEGVTLINQPIKAWIKEEDIIQSTPQAVKQIWTASQEIARKVANQFDEWEKQWERKAIKS